MGLRERLLKNSTIKETAPLSESRLFEVKDIIPLECMALNIAAAGDALFGGLTPGILQIAAESKHFKSKFALSIAKSFVDKFPEGAILFYDSEFGTPESYFQDFDTENLIHTPVMDLEKFKHDIVVQLKGVEIGEKLLVIVDSLGNIPSIKELDDAEKGNSTADMTRAKQMKSVFRMMMPMVNQKDIYVVIINHVYKTQDNYPKDVPTGGTGSIYNSNIIWTITKAKEKEAVKTEVATIETPDTAKKKAKVKTTQELVGYQFTIKIFKSRFVKEESSIPISVSFDGGISKWSGIFDLALEAGYVVNVTAQSYARKDKPTETFKRSQVEDDDAFFESLFKETDFNDWIKKEFQY